jgi:hypothetical protein
LIFVLFGVACSPKPIQGFQRNGGACKQSDGVSARSG